MLIYLAILLTCLRTSMQVLMLRTLWQLLLSLILVFTKRVSCNWHWRACYYFPCKCVSEDIVYFCELSAFGAVHVCEQYVCSYPPKILSSSLWILTTTFMELSKAKQLDRKCNDCICAPTLRLLKMSYHSSFENSIKATIIDQLFLYCIFLNSILQVVESLLAKTKIWFICNFVFT